MHSKRRELDHAIDISTVDMEALQTWSAGLFGRTFTNPDLLVEALTHASASGSGRKRKKSNERLEFLGDRVLGLTVAHILIETFPHENEGALTKRLVALVRKETLSKIARDLRLIDQLSLGVGQRASLGDGKNDAVLADLCEALLGALYIDAGYDAVLQFVERHWQPLINVMTAPPSDAKTTLQEWAQAQGKKLPVYETVSKTGPSHAPKFVVVARIEELGQAEGSGSNKRAAEQEAAAKLLKQLSSQGSDISVLRSHDEPSVKTARSNSDTNT